MSESTQVSRRALGALGVGAAVAAAAVATPALAQRGPKAMVGAGEVRQLTRGNWMEQVKAQHQAIVAGLQRVKAARTAPAMLAEFKRANVVLTGHSIAEEVVLYPGLAMIGAKPQSDQAYSEQQGAKVLAAMIDNSLTNGDMQTAATTLGQLEKALMDHVGGEEGSWYPTLMQKADAKMNAKMSADFAMHFTRYVA